jgi:hypothetical protein
LKKQLKRFREFFWPLLEPPLEYSNEEVKPLIIDDENLDKVLDLQLKKLENEDDRRKGIESKAALLLSSISIASSLVVAANSLVINNKNTFAVRGSVLIAFILTIYSIRTVWFSIKALERKRFSTLDYKDLNIRGSKKDFQKSLILKAENYLRANQIVVNDKIDMLTMAQEYYKRSIVIICLYALLICAYCFFIDRC